MPTVVCISDTHNLCEKIDIPDGDILVHAGDLTGRGGLWEIEQAANWLRSLPHKHKVIIAGNHDFDFQNWPERARSKMEGLIYLQDEETVVEGLRIYGSPWQPWFHDWAFNLPRGGPELQKKWDAIPEGLDILLTHGPPRGHGDLTTRTKERVGCQLLAKAVLKKQPRYHVFGHIHEGYGITTMGSTTLINPSTCNLQYRPVNPPVVIQVNPVEHT